MVISLLSAVRERFEYENKLGDQNVKSSIESFIAKFRSLSVSCWSVNNCLSLRLQQIIDLLEIDKSRYFAQPRSITINPHCHIIYPTYLLCNQEEWRAEIERPIFNMFSCPFRTLSWDTNVNWKFCSKLLLQFFASRMKYVGFNYTTFASLYLLEPVYVIRIGVLSWWNPRGIPYKSDKCALRRCWKYLLRDTQILFCERTSSKTTFDLISS